MLAFIVRASLAHPRIVTALSILVALLGAAALLNAQFDVFPDFAPPHVLVQAEAPGLDATQVEALVTRPLEGLLAGTANVEAVRSSSSQGLSAIQVVFTRGGDPFQQRQVVTERLAEASGDRAWSIAEDPIIARGGCRVSSESSSIDAQVEQRLGAAIAAALGDARTAAPDKAS